MKTTKQLFAKNNADIARRIIGRLSILEVHQDPVYKLIHSEIFKKPIAK